MGQEKRNRPPHSRCRPARLLSWVPVYASVARTVGTETSTNSMKVCTGCAMHCSNSNFTRQKRIVHIRNVMWMLPSHRGCVARAPDATAGQKNLSMGVSLGDVAKLKFSAPYCIRLLLYLAYPTRGGLPRRPRCEGREKKPLGFYAAFHCVSVRRERETMSMSCMHAHGVYAARLPANARPV